VEPKFRNINFETQLMRHNKKSYLAITTVFVAALGAGTVLSKSEPDIQVVKSAALPTVKFRQVTLRNVSDSQDFSGRLEAVEVVDVRPRVPGTLLTVHFKDGQHVRQGELLFTIDPAPFETQVHQAQANLAVIEERKRLGDTELARGKALIESHSIARKELDALDNSVRESAASLKGAQAALAHAQLQLSYTHVRAPISGRISRAEITSGNVINAGGDAVALTRIVSESRLYAAFNLDEQSYLHLIAPSLKVGTKPQVTVGLANDSTHPYTATVESLDNQMDTRSGTVRVRALINKVTPEMLPGLQARIRLQGGMLYEALLVDDAVISTDQDRKYVLIVNKQNKVERRFVEIGTLQGKERVIKSGVVFGDRIIVDGAFHASPGAEVSAIAAEEVGSRS
jgi:membrane fusion protein, multidrug efflux system